MNLNRFYLLFLLLLAITACKHDDEFDPDPDKFDYEVNFFFDPSRPESCHYIFSMAKSNDGSIVFSAHTYEAQATDLFRFETGKIEKIDPSTYFSGCQTYQYEEVLLYEKENLLIKFDPDEINGHRWMVTDMNDRGHSASCQKDEQGNIWIASRNSSTYDDYRRGILMYDGLEWRKFVPEWHVWSLCFDNSGNLYANTLPVPYTANEQVGVMLKYDHIEWKQMAMAGYITIYNLNDPVSGKPIDPVTYHFSSAWFSSLHIDKDNNLWASSLQRSRIGEEYGGGLYKMTLTGELQDYYHTLNQSKIPSNSILVVRTDSRNNVWTGSYFGGISKLSPDGKWETYMFPEIFGDDSFASVECLIIDGDKIYGSLWMAYGLFELRPKKP